MAQGRYNTAAREAVLAFFRATPDRQFTTEQVFEGLSKANEQKIPGKSTVYRLLSRLSDEGLLRRFRDSGDANCLYQYSGTKGCEHHFHMKCTECGKVYHLECERSDDLLFHVLSEHGFKVNCGLSMLYGQCDKCRH